MLRFGKFMDRKNHRGNLTLWIEYKKAKAKFRFETIQARKKSWNNFLENFSSSTTSQQVWKHVRLLRNKPCSRTIVIKQNSTIVSSPKEVAEVLARHFSNRNTISTDPVFLQTMKNIEKTSITFFSSSKENYNSPFSMAELKLALSTCNSKSPGPDRISYPFLKNLSDPQTDVLLKFLNFIFQNGYPHQWRESLIKPLPKPNKLATDPASYCPIALTNSMSKVLEKMVNTEQTLAEDTRGERILHSISLISEWFPFGTQCGRWSLTP